MKSCKKAQISSCTCSFSLCRPSTDSAGLLSHLLHHDHYIGAVLIHTGGQYLLKDAVNPSHSVCRLQVLQIVWTGLYLILQGNYSFVTYFQQDMGWFYSKHTCIVMGHSHVEAQYCSNRITKHYIWRQNQNNSTLFCYWRWDQGFNLSTFMGNCAPIQLPTEPVYL